MKSTQYCESRTPPQPSLCVKCQRPWGAADLEGKPRTVVAELGGSGPGGGAVLRLRHMEKSNDRRQSRGGAGAGRRYFRQPLPPAPGLREPGCGCGEGALQAMLFYMSDPVLPGPAWLSADVPQAHVRRRT